jgi:hypothetical protein
MENKFIVPRLEEHEDITKKQPQEDFTDLDAYNKDYEHLDEESFRLKNIGKIKVRLSKNK